ncbi:hypothetical protein [Bacillus sp. NEB1478]|uniref:hypothetical protein n=1 Tax=Bacillus sp. NEB1478 TaxID=3073816 RepID=UPI002873B08D|nr:hypothetical protein [Bacillus sp. NEB1478]WNB90952.1 hypothetical protein RGB74_13670 [Bacillus sp. NEB1478]
MKKRRAMLFIGLILFMVGIYISTSWTVIGTLMAIIGGFVMGSSSYFLAAKKIK